MDRKEEYGRVSEDADAADADDEKNEEDDDDEDEEDQDEDEEEPRLKYQRMGASLPIVLSADTASCITVSERMIALGTHGGTVHLLDYQGNQVKEFRSHSATVNEVSFDAAGEYVASCSDDKSVVVNGLFSNERERFEYQRPMKAVALDPDYVKIKRFAVGGLSGQLLLNTKNFWFGAKDQILHSGEGPIHAIKWRTSFIAWANDEGVKIFDTASQQRLSYIGKPKGLLEHSKPHLVWQDDHVLLIAWGCCIKIAVVRTRGSDMNMFSLGKKLPIVAGTKYVEIVSVLQTNYTICGLAPYGEALVVLAYIEDKVNGERKSSYSPKQTGHAERPEVCILTWKNEELATDALPIHGYEHYKANDYALAHAPFSGSCSAGGQWTGGDEPLYYIVSPKDVVIARQRDADDHVQWLLEHGWHEKALAAVEAGNVRTELLDKVGSQYLDHLILERQYAQVASLCSKILRGDASLWERWVFRFGQLRQLHILAPYIPTSSPQLHDTVYETVLNALLVNPAYHEQFLSLVRNWPRSIYSWKAIVSAIVIQCNTGSKSSFLLEALAELYLAEKGYKDVLQVYLELEKPAVFDFIEQHQLYDALHGKINPLLKIDAKRAITLLVQQRKRISADEVVSELEVICRERSSRQLLHDYLHALFEKDPNACRSYHGLQVELYAEYEPRLLLPFLRSSQYYSLDKAYEVCSRRGLVRERVYILGRMGNTREALSLIINKLQSMEDAIEFVISQNDEDLWEDLITQSLHIPEMAGALLEHTVGNIDPLELLRRIPKDMHVPGLRRRLVKIITDYRTETSLRRGCNNILKADRVNLLEKYYNEARRGIRVKNNSCCICSDPLAIQNGSIAVFFCGHSYHLTCLDDSPQSSSSSQRCSLCTEDEKKGG